MWFAMPLQVLCASQSVINYQKQTLVGSAVCGSSTSRVREAGCCSSPLPAWVRTYAKGSGMHLVLTCLATQANATGKKCLDWHPHKYTQHLHKHEQHSQPDLVWGSVAVTHTQMPGSWPWTPGLCSSWSPPSAIPTVTTPRPMASCDPWPFLQ